MPSQAVLLVNLGSPASYQVADVKKYLDQFLMDPYVVDLPWPVRRLLVSLILLKRPQASAHAYEQVWDAQGSPLLVHSRALREALQPLWPSGPVALAMRYGQPSLEDALRRLHEQKITEVLLAPLYPQFAQSTTTTVVEEAKALLARHRWPIELKVLAPFYAQPLYLQALADSAAPYLAQGFDHLLLSFHGLPERHLHKTDPQGGHCLASADCCQKASSEVLAQCYRAQCFSTAHSFAERAGLGVEQWSVSFQSRMGRAKWIEPYTEQRLDELARSGVKRLLVICPAFVADCLETLEEIGQRGREQFIAAGGEDLQLIPCLNAQPHWALALAQLLRQV